MASQGPRCAHDIIHVWLEKERYSELKSLIQTLTSLKFLWQHLNSSIKTLLLHKEI